MLQADLAALQPGIAALFWPFVRIGACLMVAPVFGGSFVPRRLRLLLAGMIALLLAPLLPAPPSVPLLSGAGVLITVQQVLIGVAAGFALQLLFDALSLAGQVLANSMGLGFAFNLDPVRGVSTPALGQLYTVLGMLIFLALDGHVALLGWLVDSFRALPVAETGFGGRQAFALANWGNQLFAGALQIALPGLTAMLVVNLAFGVMSRAAPALNLFAIGLPVTLCFGLAVALFSLPSLQVGFTAQWTEAYAFLAELLVRN